MPITPGTRDRLTSGLAHVIRSGRHLSLCSADSLCGALASFDWALLLPLDQGGKQRCSALAVHTSVDASVASRQLSTRERGGYVERRPDPRDGRASLMQLTDQG